MNSNIHPVANLSPNQDLGGGSLRAVDRREEEIALDEFKLSQNQKKSLFNAALALAVVLYITAISLTFVLMVTKDGNTDWHASFLVAAFVVPPTVIIIGMMKSVYPVKQNGKDSEKNDDIGIPLADISKEIMKKGFEVIAKQGIQGSNMKY
jgi:hypothetical protein